MPADMFMKIEPEVKGESTDDKHAGEIEVLSFSWGMTQAGTTHSGTGGGAAKVHVQDLSFTKYIDTATPPLLKYCASGEHFTKATLTVRKAGGKAPVEYLKITMEDLIVSSVSTGGAGGERVTETVTLNFGKYKVAYTPQDALGAAKAAAEVGYDIAKNKPV